MKSTVSLDQYDASDLDESNRKLVVWKKWSVFRGRDLNLKFL